MYKYLKANFRIYLSPFQMQFKGLQSVQPLPSVPFLSVQCSIQNPLNVMKGAAFLMNSDLFNIECKSNMAQKQQKIMLRATTKLPFHFDR